MFPALMITDSLCTPMLYMSSLSSLKFACRRVVLQLLSHFSHSGLGKF
jgi:hypothetical protein